MFFPLNDWCVEIDNLKLAVYYTLHWIQLLINFMLANIVLWGLIITMFILYKYTDNNNK